MRPHRIVSPVTRSPDTFLVDLPRGWRLTLHRLRRAFRDRSRQVVEAGESGERLVARVRLLSLALLALIQLTPLLELDSVPARVAFHSQEAVVGRRLTGSGLLVAILLWLAVRYAYRPWMGLLSIFLDVTLVSAGLAVFFALNRPLTAVNSRVVFEVYFLAIASAGLRYDWRLCVAASALAVTEYLGISLFAANHWDLTVAFGAESSYGEFGWAAQVARIGCPRRRRSDRLGRRSARPPVAAPLGEGRPHRSGQPGLVRGAPRGGAEPCSPQRAAPESRSRGPRQLSRDEQCPRPRRRGPRIADRRPTPAAVHPEERLAARLGGDEFVIVFPDTEVAQALLRLESLRREVAGLRVQGGRTAFTVTMSVGVASFPADGSGTAEVLAAADARAFEAKRLGKNRVVGPKREPGLLSHPASIPRSTEVPLA